MREGTTIEVSAADLARLEAVVADRNSPQKHVWRARVVLAAAQGSGTVEITRLVGVSKPCVRRWRERFAAEGVAGLLRDKTRPPGTPPLPETIVERVVELTRRRPPGEATHWTGRAMAKAVRISLGAVQGIWKAHGLVPHRVRTFKLSRDPEFIAKLRDVVGLYMHPPAHAIVLSVDEKSQIQALDRTQPGLPMKEGRPATMTHDYVRHGTTTLFAALNILDGTVVGRCMQRHRHQEFIRFLNAVEAAVPAGKLIHAILDNYGTHKHPKVRAWLERHPRWTFHFTPTSASWLNAVEGFFATLTKRRLRRGSFASLVDLQAAINRYLAETNADPRPFVWTAEPEGIIEKVRRGYQASQSLHSHVPFQGAKARVFVSRSARKRSIRSAVAHGRGRRLETTVDHTLMRGLATAGPCSVSGLPRSRSGRR
jgi:transposase